MARVRGHVLQARQLTLNGFWDQLRHVSLSSSEGAPQRGLRHLREQPLRPGFGFWTWCEVGKRNRRARRALGTKADAKLDQCVGQRALGRPAAVMIEDVVDLSLDVIQSLLNGITEFAHGKTFQG
jgi:hypothetical protein